LVGFPKGNLVETQPKVSRFNQAGNTISVLPIVLIVSHAHWFKSDRYELHTVLCINQIELNKKHVQGETMLAVGF